MREQEEWTIPIGNEILISAVEFIIINRWQMVFLGCFASETQYMPTDWNEFLCTSVGCCTFRTLIYMHIACAEFRMKSPSSYFSLREFIPFILFCVLFLLCWSNTKLKQVLSNSMPNGFVVIVLLFCILNHLCLIGTGVVHGFVGGGGCRESTFTTHAHQSACGLTLTKWYCLCCASSHDPWQKTEPFNINAQVCLTKVNIFLLRFSLDICI